MSKRKPMTNDQFRVAIGRVISEMIDRKDVDADLIKTMILLERGLIHLTNRDKT